MDLNGEALELHKGGVVAMRDAKKTPPKRGQLFSGT